MPTNRYPHIPVEMQTKVNGLVDSYARQMDKQLSPPIIFHYTNDIGLLGIIKTRKLRLTDIFHLNDPTELRHGCGPAIKLVVTAAKKDSRPELKQFAEKFQELLHGDIEQSAHFFALSFSKVGNDLGQWRAYADDGRGYAIGFDARTLEQAFVTQGPTRMTYNVSYSENDLRSMHKQIIDQVLSFISILPAASIFENMNELLTFLAVPVTRVAAFFKHKSYSNEREYRFLEFFQYGSVDTEVKYRSRRYSLIPYRELDWRNLAPDALKEIMLGPAADAERARRFAEDCLGLFHVGGVKISRSLIPYRAV